MTCSSPAPSWRRRPRPPTGWRTASAAPQRRWSSWVEGRIDRYMDRVELPPKFVIPGRQRALRAARRRPHGRAPGRAPDRGPRRAGRAGGETILHLVNRASDLVYAMARFADVETRRCSRAGSEPEPREGPGPPPAGLRARGRHRGRPHALVVDEPASERGHRHRALPGPPARRQPRLLHGGDDGDVRVPQGMGLGAGGGRRRGDLRESRTERLRGHREAAGRARRGAAPRPSGDRRQMSRAQGAERGDRR